MRAAIAVSVLALAPLGCERPGGNAAPAGSLEAAAPARPAPDRTLPNVVLITIDTLRADHCSFAGYERDTTPFLAELAEEATVFDAAYATASWTAPSMASIFVSLPPRSHGVVYGFLRGDGRPTRTHNVLSERFTTIPEVLRARGYRTFGVTSNAHASMITGFGQGFDELEEVSWQNAGVVNATVRRISERVKGAEPYFLWVHYFDPHAPYYARRPWIRDYADEAKTYRAWAGQTMPDIQRGTSRFASVPEERQALVDLYDSEINYADAAVRDLFEKLGIDRSGLIIVTSDHGEAFLEHGQIGHGSTLFDPQSRVPLLLKLPEGHPEFGGRRVTAPVSILDVLPTVAEVAGARAPEGVAGRSLLATAADGAPQRPVPMELERRTERIEGVRFGRWKVVRQLEPELPTRMYDLGRDPTETVDVAAERPAVLRAVEAVWEKWKGEWPVFEAPTLAGGLTHEQVEELQALGYTGD